MHTTQHNRKELGVGRARGRQKSTKKTTHSQSESVIGGVEHRGNSRGVFSGEGSWRRNVAAAVASSSLQSGSRLIVLQQDIHK